MERYRGVQGGAEGYKERGTEGYRGYRGGTEGYKERVLESRLPPRSRAQ